MLNITIRNTSDYYDSDDIIFEGRTIGFKGKISGSIGLTKCPLCDKENYAMAVSRGICIWCGFDLNKEKI